MKQRAVKMLLWRFLSSFLILSLLIGVGIISYQMVLHFWGITVEAPAAVPIIEHQEKIGITPVRIDDISKNLIYCIDEETGEIIKVTLEIFQCSEKKMTYITIPVRTQYTMSNSLYQKLIVVYPAIPQLLKLSNITKYFSDETVYEYGCLIIEDLLDTSISYYSTIPESLYQTMFVTTSTSGELEQSSIPMDVFSESYKELLKSLQTEEELRQFIQDTYPSIQSNLTLFGKMNYAESYCGTLMHSISFELLSGKDKNSAYIIDVAMAKQQIAACSIGNE